LREIDRDRERNIKTETDNEGDRDRDRVGVRQKEKREGEIISGMGSEGWRERKQESERECLGGWGWV
jgi:hypothetical protein